MIKLNTRTLVLGASLAALIVIAAIILFFKTSVSTSPAADVKGVSTTTRTTNPQNDQEKSENTSTPESTASTAMVAAPRATKPASSPAASNKPVGTPVPSTTSVNVAPVPSVPNTPAPQPTFQIALREDDAYIQKLSTWNGDISQYVVPFDIILDAGFAAKTYEMPNCRFTAVPAANHGMLCHVGQKVPGSGTLIVQYKDTNAAGSYAVEVSYGINGIVRTDTLGFSLAEILDSSN